MKIKCLFVIAAVTLSAQCCFAARLTMKEVNTVHSELVTDYGLMSQYFANHNLQGISDLTAPGYVALAPGEPPVDRQHMMMDFKAQMSMLQNAVWKRTILKLAFKPGQVLALVTGHMTATAHDRSGKSHAFVLDAVSVDTWVPINGKLEVLHSQVMRVQASMDGHVMPNQ